MDEVFKEKDALDQVLRCDLGSVGIRQVAFTTTSTSDGDTNDTPHGRVAVLPPPLFSEHADELLSSELNYSKEQINDLRKRGIIV
jgi:hypothetical protein